MLNRGEAAVRFIRAARSWAAIHQLPLECIAFYTNVDRAAPFVRMSQHAVSLGEPVQTVDDGSSRSAYVDVDRVIELAKGAEADALWPGWGFLAESAELAEALVPDEIHRAHAAAANRVGLNELVFLARIELSDPRPGPDIRRAHRDGRPGADDAELALTRLRAHISGPRQGRLRAAVGQ